MMSSRGLKIRLVVVMCFSSSLLVFYITYSHVDIHTARFRYLNNKSSYGYIASQPKRMLFWGSTKLAHNFGYGVETFKRKCKMDTCELVEDLTHFPQVDAVIFYVKNVSGNMQFPSYASITPDKRAPGYPLRAHADQKFVFFHMESPSRTHYLGHLSDMFNLTMTYLDHPDTDILQTHGLGNIKALSEAEMLETVRKKRKLVAWVVSNCQRVPSNRIWYIKSMQKYIDVDIYGKCGTPCNDTWLSMDCFLLIEKHYKFYLAFENSLCDDYITEKMYRTLGLNLIPIALNGANNNKYLPPSSYIDMRHFRSAQHLAQYLQELDANETKYMEYFAWKKHYKRPVGGKSGICQLCDILHNTDYKFKSHFDPATYWNADISCNNMALPGQWNYPVHVH